MDHWWSSLVIKCSDCIYWRYWWSILIDLLAWLVYICLVFIINYWLGNCVRCFLIGCCSLWLRSSPVPQVCQIFLLCIDHYRPSSVTLMCQRCSLWKPAYQLLTFAPSGGVWRRTASLKSPPIRALRSSPRSKWNGSIIRLIRWSWRPELFWHVSMCVISVRVCKCCCLITLLMWSSGSSPGSSLDQTSQLMSVVLLSFSSIIYISHCIASLQ